MNICVQEKVIYTRLRDKERSFGHFKRIFLWINNYFLSLIIGLGTGNNLKSLVNNELSALNC